MMKIIGKGAEANIFLDENTIIKDRIPKKYRHPKIDDFLRKTRTRKETKVLQQMEGIAPKILSTDKESKIEMEYIEGSLIKRIIEEKPNLAKEIGRITGEMHDKNIVHGDLTTSNMLLDKNNKIRLIDFGLSQHTHKIEDKAVDIHLFKESVQSKHYKSMKKIVDKFIKGYNPSNKKEILNRLDLVEKRGRNKEKY